MNDLKERPTEEDVRRTMDGVRQMREEIAQLTADVEHRAREVERLRAEIEVRHSECERAKQERDYYKGRNVELTTVMNLIIDLIDKQRDAEAVGQLRQPGSRQRPQANARLPEAVPEFLTKVGHNNTIPVERSLPQNDRLAKPLAGLERELLGDTAPAPAPVVKAER